MEITEEKAALRAKMRQIRTGIENRERDKAASSLVQRLTTLPAVKHAKGIGVYSAYGSELSLRPSVEMLRQRDLPPTIAYPVMVNETTMVFVSFSADDDKRVLENPTTLVTNIPPERVVDPAGLELILVPGLAFDTHGNRLGQGGGFYDRFLPHTGSGTITIGIAFDEQIIDAVPTGPHDRRVNYILTPTRLITAS